MGRNAVKKEDALRYDVKTRINQDHFDRLNSLLKASRYRTMAELIREIICEKPVTIYSVDQSLASVVEELARIRKEINSIGVNINQVVRHFNTSESRIERLEIAFQLQTIHQQLTEQMNLLVPVINELTKKWLQG